MFGEKVLNVRARGSEYLELLLDSNVRPGLYQVMFTLQGRSGGVEVTRHSPIFVFHKQGPNAEVLTLNVEGRHYDSPAEQVLNLPRTSWKLLKREVEASNSRLYLGPSPYEVIYGKPDQRWLVRKVKTVPGDDKNAVQWSAAEPSTVVMDLGTPVDEELFSTDDAFARTSGTDKWQDLLPIQINRRGARK